MKKSRLDPVLLAQILQETLPEQPPSLVGNTPDYGLFLASYQNYHNCYVPEHNSPFHTLEITDESSLLFHRRILGDKEIKSPLLGGEVSIYPAHNNFFLEPGYDQGQGLSFTLVTLDVNLVEELSREEFGFNSVELIAQFLVSDTEQLKGLVNIIKQEIRAGYPNGSLFLEDMTNALIRNLIRKSATSRKPINEKKPVPLTNKRIQLVKERLRENLRENLQLEDFEEDTGVSKFQICRSFQQAEGISMTAYRKKLRVEQAQQLLRDKSWSIAKIAQECGFHDASHLNRYFKALTGMTPTHFREQFKKRIDI